MADDGEEPLAAVGGEVVVGGDVLEDVVETGEAFVLHGGVLSKLAVVAGQGLVEEGAMVGGERGVTLEEHLHIPAVVLETGKGVGNGVGALVVVGTVGGTLGVAQEWVEEGGGMECLLLLGNGELLPEVVEGERLEGDGVDGFAVVDFVIDIVDALGGEDAGGVEGVEGAVGHAERHDIVEPWHLGVCRLGQDA